MAVRLSVIVPVYNVEDYLDECLQSLADQDWHNFEAICVNDGSTDGSRQILERWAQREPWIRLVDKPNGGLSSARNAGMRVAKGDYLCFLDSDDHLLPQACRRIVEVFDLTDSEVIVFGGKVFPPEESTPWLEETLTTKAISYGGPCEELLFSPDTRPFAWRTALSRAFVERDQVYFDEAVGYGEDQVFQFAAYARSQRTTVVEDCLYEYRASRSGSLMNEYGADAREKLLEHVSIIGVVWEDYRKLGILDEYDRAMLSWACQFVAVDALLMSEDSCSEVLSALGRQVAVYWSEDELDGMGLEPIELRILQAAMEGKSLRRSSRRRLFVRLHRRFYGRRSALQRLLRR